MESDGGMWDENDALCCCRWLRKYTLKQRYGNLASVVSLHCSWNMIFDDKFFVVCLLGFCPVLEVVCTLMMKRYDISSEPSCMSSC
jgi:hypothetical protein